MKNWTIGKRVTVGFGTLLVLVIGLAVTNIVMLTGIKGHLAEIVDDGMVGMGLSAKVSFNTGESERLQLEYLRAKTDIERSDAEAKINALIAENNKLLKDYEQTIVREEDRKNFDRLMATRVAFGAQRSKMFELARAGKIAEAEAQNLASGPAFNAFQTACNAMFDANSDFGTTTGRAAQADLVQMRWIIIGVTLFSVLVGGGFAALIVVGLKRVLRHVSAALQDGSEQMVSASSQVSAASQSLAEGASEQAASLEETSSSLEEMSSMTRRNADNAENAKKLADQTRAAADMGATDMKEMSQAMAEIKNASDNIAKIIKTIDEIAFQTNILALNAAVEAARAGEAGMGFAVVADEVRRLAQRSANAAKETADKIQDAITKSEHGVRISSKVAQSLGDIVTKACQVDQLIGDIAAASKEQSQGITQVNMAVTQMDKVTQSSAASAEETASAAEELNAQAESLKDAVVELARLVEQRGLVEKPRLVHKKTSPADDALSAAMGDFAHAGGSRNGKSEKHQPSQTLTTPANANLQMIPSRKEPAAATDADFRDF